jgi:hypothetical protein
VDDPVTHGAEILEPGADARRRYANSRLKRFGGDLLMGEELFKYQTFKNLDFASVVVPCIPSHFEGFYFVCVVMLVS